MNYILKKLKKKAIGHKTDRLPGRQGKKRVTINEDNVLDRNKLISKRRNTCPAPERN